MNYLLYAFFILGSFSPGYMLLRAGFPSTQNWGMIQKISLGYFLGLILFGLPVLVIAALGLNETYYSLLCIILITLLFGVMFVKRISLQEVDPVIPKVEKKKKPFVQEVPASIVEKTQTMPQKKIVFEQGLIVKSKEGETKKQVFKEKPSNIVNTVIKNTAEIENKTKENEKNEALERLRKFAQQIKLSKKQTKTEDEDGNEIEEDLLSKMSDETEEEYL
ncbi:MAG: hypothetical protein WC821_00475 [archaeon]|jgi:hypothetical protein